MSFEGVDPNRTEQEVQNLHSWGSLPMEAFRTLILPNLEQLEHFVSRNSHRLKIIGILLGLSLVNVACEQSKPVDVPGFPEFSSGITAEDFQQARETYVAGEEKPWVTPAVEQVADSDSLRPYLVEASTSWRFGGQVTESDTGGIWAAFTRMAREKGLEFQWLNEVPEGMTEVVEIWRNGQMVALHSVSNVLETNPKIYPGDTITHTFVTEESLTNMQRDNGLRAEDIHL